MFDRVAEILNRLDVDTEYVYSGNCRDISPITGEEIASLPITNIEEINRSVLRAAEAFDEWGHRSPKERRNLIYAFADELRLYESDLATLIMIETGKIYEDALSEVRRSISICEYAAGVSQRLTGFTAPSGKIGLTVMQSWTPLGVVCVMSSFNFPMRVWVFDAMLALACGNTVIWRPSRKAALTAYAVNHILKRAASKSVENCPENISQIVVCSHTEAMALAKNRLVSLLSATGSPVLTRNVVSLVGQRFGRTLMASGGNNAAVITPSANKEYAVRKIVKSTVLDGGQRPTSLQRLFCHESVYDEIRDMIFARMQELKVDSPMEKTSALGPLIDREAYDLTRFAMEQSVRDGGTVHGGDRVFVGSYDNAFYMRPTLIEMPTQTSVMKTDVLAPVLFMMPYKTIEEAVALTNAAPDTLIASLFCQDMKECGRFRGLDGVTAAVVGINTGTDHYDLMTIASSEQNGRMTGSDAWRSFMTARTTYIDYAD